MIEIDFNVYKSLILGLRGALRRECLKDAIQWLDKMDEMVETAAYQEIAQPGEKLQSKVGIVEGIPNDNVFAESIG